MTESETVASNRIEFQSGSKLQGTSSEALEQSAKNRSAHRARALRRGVQGKSPWAGVQGMEPPEALMFFKAETAFQRKLINVRLLSLRHYCKRK